MHRIISLQEDLFYNKDISLRKPSRIIEKEEISQSWMLNLISEMFKILYSTPNGIGLAAPQIGVHIKLIVLDLKRDAKKPLILINPQYKELSSEQTISNETCLSIPKYSGQVFRYDLIKVNYYNLKGESIDEEFDTFLSHCMQHEIDHLDGILYVDKLVINTSLVTGQTKQDKLVNKAIEVLKL